MKKEIKPPNLESDPIVKAVAREIEKATGQPAPSIHKINRLMPPDEYLELVTNYERWFEKAVGIECCAEVIWQQFVHTFQSRGDGHLSPAYLETAHMLYGLSIEVALKGELIRIDPDNVRLVKSRNKKGVLDRVSFKGIRGVKGDGHDLVQLAEQAGLLSEPNTRDIRNALIDLTRCIRWQSRYPVPKESKGDGPASNVHFVLKNQWIKDWVRPLLDQIIGKYRTAK